MVALLGGYWFSLAKDELREIDDLLSEIRGLQSTQSLNELQTAYLRKCKTDSAEVRGWIDEVMELHTVEGPAQDFLLQADAALRDCHLIADSVQPGSVFERDRLKEQSLTVSVQGLPEDLLIFIRRMEQSAPFCRVTNVRIDQGSARGLVQAQVVLSRLWRET